jgi:hypothetical protein
MLADKRIVLPSLVSLIDCYQVSRNPEQIAWLA